MPNKRMSRRQFLKMLSTVSAGMVLASCTPQAVPEPTQELPTLPPEATKAPEATKVPEATKIPEATATTAPTMKKYKGETIVSISVDTITAKTAYESLIAAYNVYQPDVKVLFEGPPQGTDYTTWLGTQMAAGTPRPDIISGNYQPNYGKFVNLDKYRFQTNPYTNTPWDETVNWDFYVERNAKGERRMIATEAVHVMWYYNKDIFDKVGVQPPTTWDELVVVCEKLLAAGYTPIATNFVWKIVGWTMEVYTDQYHRDWLEYWRSQPGDYNYDEEIDGKFKFDPNDSFIDNKFTTNISRYWQAVRDGKISYDTPQMADMVRNFAKIFPKYASKTFFIDQMAEDYTQFLQQEAAIIIDGTWSLTTLKKDMENLTKLSEERMKALKLPEGAKLQPFNWSTFEYPAMQGDLVKFNVRSVESAGGVYGSAIDKTSEQTELDMDFMMFWYSKEGYQAWIDGYAKSPTGYQIAGPVMVKDVKLTPDVEAIMSNIKMRGNAENPYGFYMPTWFAGEPTVEKQAFDTMKDALEGKMTPEEFAKSLQKIQMDNLDALLKQAGLTKENLDHPERAPGA